MILILDCKLKSDKLVEVFLSHIWTSDHSGPSPLSMEAFSYKKIDELLKEEEDFGRRFLGLEGRGPGALERANNRMAPKQELTPPARRVAEELPEMIGMIGEAC